MDLATIEVDPETAKQAVADYRGAVKERHDEEDEMMLRAYREAAKGTPLIKLSEAIAAGGFDTIKAGVNTVRVPRIAVCRAHRKFAWTNGVTRSGSLRIQGKREIALNNTYDVVGVPSGTFPESDRSELYGYWGGLQGAGMWALVPNVPPPLRPAHSLANYYVLWEVESWTHIIPPGDPALLKRIGGDLYAVLAVWDLTEIEQAVLSGRRPA